MQKGEPGFNLVTPYKCAKNLADAPRMSNFLNAKKNALYLSESVVIPCLYKPIFQLFHLLQNTS